MNDLIYRQSAINAIENTECELLSCEWDELTNAIKQVPSAEQDNDMIHLQKEQAYLQGWEEGREALKQSAIDAVEKESQVDGAYGYMDTKSIVDLLSDLPSAEPKIIHCGECAFAEVLDIVDVQDGYVCQFHHERHSKRNRHNDIRFFGTL